MVNPISYQPQQAFSGGADFSMLANLGNVYQKAQEQARQQSALAALGQGQDADAQTLVRSGVLPLAQLGLGMQDKTITRQREDQRNVITDRRADSADTRAGSYLTIAQEQAKRAAEKAEEDTPEGRDKKLIGLGLDPKDPNYTEYRLTGQNPPNLVQQQQAAKSKYELAQAQKYDTREKRLAAAEAGGLDKTNPTIMQWIALGGDPPDVTKGRLGIGAPLFTQNLATGEVVAHQLRNDQPFVTPEGHRLLGPGEIAQQKAAGAATGKATGLAQVALPKVVDNALHQTQLLDEISTHPGRMWATGIMSKAPDAMLVGTAGAGFRARFGQLNAQSFLSIYDQLRGAGQITNTEGDKGTSAVNRMSAATNEKEFDDAVKDLKSVLKVGVERAQRAAKGDFNLHPKELQDLQTRLGVAAPGGTAADKPDPLNLR